MTTHEQPEADRTVEEPPARRAWSIVLTAAVVAGVGSWLAGEGVLRAYRSGLMPPMKPIPTDEDARQILAARVASGTAIFAAAGGFLGLALGLAGGASRRSVGLAASAGLVGLGAGALGQAGVARLALPVLYTKLDVQSSDLMLPLLAHEAIWTVAGLAGGLAFGLGLGGRGRWPRTALGGLIGAGLGVVAFEFAGALIFPTHRTHMPVAGSPEARALAQLLVAVGTAVGLVMASDEPPARRASP